MNDRSNNQQAKIAIPPAWCSSLCRNSMNEVCVEACAKTRDCSGFELRQELSLGEMPRFPLRDVAAMTKQERFVAVIVYLAKVVDHLQGVQIEPAMSSAIRRHNRHEPEEPPEQSPAVGIQAAAALAADRAWGRDTRGGGLGIGIASTPIPDQPGEGENERKTIL